MRNFYKRLNIKRTLTDGQALGAARECPNKALRDDADFVFSSKTRKAAYDNLNDTLVTIGRLRPSLGLSHTDKWSGEIAAEYTDPSYQDKPLLPDLMNRLDRASKKKAAREKEEAQKKGWIWWPIIIFGLFGYFIYVDSQSSSSSSYQPKDTFAQKHQAHSFPYNGKVVNLTRRDAVAPFQIKTQAGQDYVIKLKTLSERDAVIVYVHGGRTVNVDVPMGRYKLYYASGDTWYGNTHLFGPDTAYSKSDSQFNFQLQGNQYMGYTVSLYRVSNGNMNTRSIPRESF
ncbi:hypothetical protein [Halomonas aestuarii]|uniref:hypothetical protein n=1 Tax=Halomonas aestuarii TaxID=1897729 RepID=UPI000F7AA564|nr:hypothetical protein [Halomonas aestuarii]